MEPTNTKFAGSCRCHFCVLAIETGGRWSPEAADCVRRCCARSSSSIARNLHLSINTAIGLPGACLLSLAAARAFANRDGDARLPRDLLADAAEGIPFANKMP